MKKLSLGVLILSVMFSGCLSTTHPLPGVDNKIAAKDLIGGWTVGKQEVFPDLTDNHNFLNIFLTDKDLIIVSSKEKLVDAAEAFKACKEDLAICYEGQISEATVVNNWKLMSLTDHFRQPNENFYLIVAYAIGTDGELAIYNISDDSIRKVISEGKLSKEGNSADINSDPEIIISWLKSLKADEFKIYAKYKKAV